MVSELIFCCVSVVVFWIVESGNGEEMRAYLYTPSRKAFQSKTVEDVLRCCGRHGRRDGVSVRDIFSEGEGGGGKKEEEEGGCVYVSSFSLSDRDGQRGFLPLSYRTGRDEVDGDGCIVVMCRRGMAIFLSSNI